MLDISKYILYGFAGFIVFLLVYIILVLQQRAAYFKKNKVPYLGVGLYRAFRTLTGITNLIALDEEIYKDAKKTGAPIVAVTDVGGSVSLIVTDPEIIKRVTVKDFDHFVNQRGLNTEKSGKYLMKMLFFMQNEKWKASRVKMTPAFTSGKIKRMFEMISMSSQRLDKYLKEQMGYPEKTSMDVDFFKLLYKYSMSVIASTAFGVDSKSWETELNQFSTFEQFAKKIELKFDVVGMFKFAIITLAPKLADMLQLEVLDYSAQQYFANVVKEVLKHRRDTGQTRNDFVQLMMDIQQGTLKGSEEDGNVDAKQNELAEKFVFDDDYVTANAMLFFLGGFDTTQTVLLFSVYSLALDQEIQEKLYEEVQDVMNKYRGKLGYEALMEMTYLDMVITETLRLYPAASRLERQCTADYVVEETGFKIKKGTLLVIPSYGIHTDSEHYENPQKFDPERWSPENKANRHHYTYLPFGQGPRACIGMRFALLKIKAAIAQIVVAYKLSPCSKTTIPMKFENGASARPVGGMWLNVTVRE